MQVLLPRRSGLCKALHNLGRKNYLFVCSYEWAQRAIMVYSFVGTCKLNNVKPFHWLRDVITHIPDHKANKLDEL